MLQATTGTCPHCSNPVAVVLWAPTVGMELQAMGVEEETEEPPPPPRKKRKQSEYNRFIKREMKGGGVTLQEAAKRWKAHKANGKG